MEVKRVVDPRAIWGLYQQDFDDGLDTAGEEKEYDDSCFSGSYNWNGGAIHKEIIRRDHFDETPQVQSWTC